MESNFVRGSSVGAGTFPCQEQRKFPTNTSCLVTVQYIGEDCSLWVLQNAEINLMEHVSKFLNDSVPGNNDRLNSIAVNDVVCALDNSDGCWYRAKILGTDPVTVQFIDFGNVSHVPPENVAPLSPLLCCIHPLAVNVKLVSNSSVCPCIGDELHLTYITSENGVAVVSAAASCLSTSKLPEAVEHNSGNSLYPNLACQPSDSLCEQTCSANLTSDYARATTTDSMTPLSRAELQTPFELTLNDISSVPCHFEAESSQKGKPVNAVRTNLRQPLTPDLPEFGRNANELIGDVYREVEADSLLDGPKETPLETLPNSRNYDTCDFVSAVSTVMPPVMDSDVQVICEIIPDAPKEFTSDMDSGAFVSENVLSSMPVESPDLSTPYIDDYPQVEPHSVSISLNEDSITEAANCSVLRQSSDLRCILPHPSPDLTEFCGDANEPTSDVPREVDANALLDEPREITTDIPLNSGSDDAGESFSAVSTSVPSDMDSDVIVICEVIPDASKEPTSDMDSGAFVTENVLSSMPDLSTPYIDDYPQVEPHSVSISLNEDSITEAANCSVLRQSSDLRCILPHPSPDLTEFCGDAYEPTSDVPREVDANALLDEPREITTDIPLNSGSDDAGESVSAVSASIPSDIGERISALPKPALSESSDLPLDVPDIHRDANEEIFTLSGKVSDSLSKSSTVSGEGVCETLPEAGSGIAKSCDSSSACTTKTVSDASREVTTESVSDVPARVTTITLCESPSDTAKTVSGVSRDGTPGTFSNVPRAGPVRTVADTGDRMGLDTPSSMRRLPHQSDSGLSASARVFKMSVPPFLLKGQGSRPLLPSRENTKWKKEPTNDSFPQPQTNMKSDNSSCNMEFEVKIMQEQNRIQMLQLQQRIEQELAYQINSIKQEMAKQVSMIGQKFANAFADIALLKNDITMLKNAQCSKLASCGLPSINSVHQWNSGQSCNMQPFQDKTTAGHPNGYQNHRGNNNASSFISQNEHSDQRSSNQNHQGNMNTSPFIPLNQHSEQRSSNNLNNSYESVEDMHSSGQSDELSDYKNTYRCICVKNLPEKITVDHLYNLFGVYGNVQRVKKSPPGMAFVELSDHAQAAMAVHYLHNAPLMNAKLHVSPCKYESVRPSRKDFELNLGKDFSKHPRLHRFMDDKWDACKLAQPCNALMINNLLWSVSDDELKEVFAKEGFSVVNIRSKTTQFNKSKKYAFLTFESTEAAVNALTVMHLKGISDWPPLRVSFAFPFPKK